MFDAELLASVPFVLMLLFIAVGPLVRDHWWDRNNQYIVVVLGGIVVYAEWFIFGAPQRVWHTALEYVAFISLIGSLFVVAGGIVIRVGGAATPLKNSLLLLVGAVLANLVGTTGASMLLIRPFLHLNRDRLRPYLVVFFIFLVSNVGGALTPIGDPPLFLGYLKGIPFFWPLANAAPAWALALAALLALFAILDARNPRPGGGAEKRGLVVLGRHNILFLGVTLGAVFLPTPRREMLMIAAAAASYQLTPDALRKEHDFSFRPIVEVATLFAGVFATMIPALAWLERNARVLGLESAGAFFWATGFLSAVLDNAPTYLSLLSAAQGATGQDVPGLLATAPELVRAISVAAVFFGAGTYIGNGPNLMVKCIADQAGAKCPTFAGYVVCYALPILLPLFVLVWLVFFR